MGAMAGGLRATVTHSEWCVGGGHPVRGPDGEFGCEGTMRRVTGVIGMPFIGARECPCAVGISRVFT